MNAHDKILAAKKVLFEKYDRDYENEKTEQAEKQWREKHQPTNRSK